MRYFYAEKQINTPFGDIVDGELITEREAAKSKKKEYIHRHCQLVEWPAKHTHFKFGVRFRSKDGCITIRPNGDPYGRGFVGTMVDFPSDNFGTYMGDISPASLAVWRDVANFRNCILVEE